MLMLRLLASRVSSHSRSVPTASAVSRFFLGTHSSDRLSRAGLAMVASSSDSDWSRISTGPTPYTVFTKPIQKSQQDDRDYRLIRLDNGLQAMLVHDAKADKAAASLDVAVGHLYDPDDMPGLAHFCEHLLFMGTEQYPRENEYSEFLAKNNGGSNAYTGASNTNYFFSVSTTALSGALSRFAGFFHCPLFAPSCTSRELNAVDSEHKKNLQNDMWRIFQVNKHLTKEGHPWQKFGSGNRESLSKVGRELKAKAMLSNGNISSVTSSLAPSPTSSRVPSPAPTTSSTSSELEGDGGVVGRETRRRLVEWWSKEYCAGRMRLCVLGKESLDELADMVASLFSPIPNRGQEPLPMIHDHPFGPNEMGTLVSVQTIMSFHALEVSFPIPYDPDTWQYKPASFLSNFIGHEGPGSLHSYLKHKGWITALSSGPQPLGRSFGMLRTTLHLTPEGFENYRSVMLSVFKYLSLLRSSSFPSWYQREMSIIHLTRFRFSEKRRPDDYAVWISEHMAWPVPRELVLKAPELVWEWDEKEMANGGEKEMRDMLNSLRIDKGRIVLMAKSEEYERLNGNALQWEHEPWYGTPYSVQRLDQDFVAQAESPNNIPELFLPGPNEFLPTNLDVDKREVAEPLKRPHLIRETAISSLWHKKDDQFWVPKARIIMDIRSPVANTSARAGVLTRLFADLVNDSLTEFAYDADLAGLRYDFTGQTLGLYVIMSGYNDKLHVLAKDVLERVKNLQIKPERLAVMKDQAKRDYENFFLGQPYRLSDFDARYLLTQQQYTLTEKLAEVSSITVEELQIHILQLLSKINMRLLVVGNMYRDEAVRFAEMAETILQASPISPSAVVERALIPPDGSNHIWSTPVPNVNEPNSSLSYYVHFGSVLDPHLRVTGALLSQILAEPAFNVLRTKEQLGYIVASSLWIMAGDSAIGLRIVVQSERGPAYLEERVEVFLDEMKTKIQEMSDTEFNEQKAGLERKWREALKNLSEETNRYWGHIDSGHHDFLRREHDADLLQSITKKDVISLFLGRVHPSSSTRAKLSVHLQSQKARPPKISIAAMGAFEAAALRRGAVVDQQKWREELAAEGEPLLAQFIKFWQDMFAQEGSLVSPEVAEELFKTIPTITEEHPAVSDCDGKLNDGVVLIQDPKAFRASLRISEDPRPVVQWGDLPTSKF